MVHYLGHWSTRLPEKVVLLFLEQEQGKEEERFCCVRSFTKAGWKLWHSGTGCAYFTAVGLIKVATVGIHLTKVTPIHLRTYKFMGGRLELFQL